MDILIDWVPYEFEFMGDKATCEVRRLKSEAFMKLAPYMKLAGEEDAVKITVSMFEMQQLVPLIFPDHVRNLQGITINGQPPTTQQLSEEPVLVDVVFDIVTELITLSRIGKDEAKNSKRQSGEMTEAENLPLS